MIAWVPITTATRSITFCAAAAKVSELIRVLAREMPETARDRTALQLALRKRRDKAREYFDELAGKFGRSYVPGRSWQALAHTLISLLPALTVADLDGILRILVLGDAAAPVERRVGEREEHAHLLIAEAPQDDVRARVVEVAREAELGVAVHVERRIDRAAVESAEEIVAGITVEMIGAASAPEAIATIAGCAG